MKISDILAGNQEIQDINRVSRGPPVYQSEIDGFVIFPKLNYFVGKSNYVAPIISSNSVIKI